MEELSLICLIRRDKQSLCNRLPRLFAAVSCRTRIPWSSRCFTASSRLTVERESEINRSFRVPPFVVSSAMEGAAEWLYGCIWRPFSGPLVASDCLC